MTPIHVACAIERDYYKHCAAMLLSLLDHNKGGEIEIHLLHPPELGGGPISRLQEMVVGAGGLLHSQVVPDELCTGLPIHDFTRKATWYRIFLDELLPGLDRVLYLDSDLIVHDSLQPLWEIELNGNYVAAVTNVLQADHFGRPAEIGVDNHEDYFNAGVLLCDLALMRAHGLGTQTREWSVANASRLEWRDQDALNAVLAQRRLRLHPRWNLMSSVLLFPWAVEVFGVQAIAEAKDNPAIRHFEGQTIAKPWHLLCDRPGRDEYFEYRSRTPWPRVRRSGVTPGNLVRKAARGSRGPG